MFFSSKDLTYYKLTERQLSVNAIIAIRDLLIKDRENHQDKAVKNPVLVAYCDCSDRSLEDLEVSDARYNIGTMVTYIDPNNEHEVELSFAHEMIHHFQNHLYHDLEDETECEDYADRWEEKQARRLEHKVRDILKDNFVETELMSDHERIEDYLDGLSRKVYYKKSQKEDELVKHLQKSKSIDDYFDENADKHNY